MAPQKCYFLDALPVELRLSIYEHLVVAPSPLRGPSARHPDEKYNLDLSILRVNRQVHQESRSMFFGKNTFYITPPLDTTTGTASEPAPQQPAFDPPLQPSQMPLLRHLTVDLLYYPSTPLITEPGPNGTGWKPISAGATAYVNALTTLFTSCNSALQTLRLTSTVRESFCAKKCLVSFFMCDRSRPFCVSLAGLDGVKTIPISFEFPDCYYRAEVERDAFTKRSILLLACQVMFCQSQVRITALLRQFEEDGGVGKIGEGGKADLGPFVGSSWPGKGEGVGAGEAMMGFQ